MVEDYETEAVNKDSIQPRVDTSSMKEAAFHLASSVHPFDERPSFTNTIAVVYLPDCWT